MDDGKELLKEGNKKVLNQFGISISLSMSPSGHTFHISLFTIEMDPLCTIPH
jgi:hypothetical protein